MDRPFLRCLHSLHGLAGVTGAAVADANVMADKSGSSGKIPPPSPLVVVPKAAGEGVRLALEVAEHSEILWPFILVRLDVLVDRSRAGGDDDDVSSSSSSSSSESSSVVVVVSRSAGMPMSRADRLGPQKLPPVAAAAVAAASLVLRVRMRPLQTGEPVCQDEDKLKLQFNGQFQFKKKVLRWIDCSGR